MYRLEDQREQLEHLNKTKNKFLGMCAHDMRNPLTSIMGFCELIMSGETGDLNDDMKKFLEIIYTSSLKMLDMINNLLDITVIESGRLELHLHRGSIKALLEEQVEISRFLAERKSISIKSKLDNTSEINFDKYRISQVLDNIIGNAIKYSPQGSIIYVTLQENNGFIRIAVRDEGPGIPKEDQEKMFQEYRRLKAQATGGEKSAGLGLAIAKKIMDYHNGTITVDSQPGKGATFVISLPVKS